MRRGTIALAAALSVAPLGAAAGQVAEDARRGYATRAGLEQLLVRLEASAESPAYSSRLRDDARRDAAFIRTRLQQGDFQVGDRVLLTVDREEALTDSFTVREGPELVLPTIGAVSLRGVLRAELEDHLRSEIARYVRDPVVRSRTVLRLSFTGAIGSAGFHSIPTETPLTDALMAAGGPSGSAKLDEIRIERNGETVWDGDEVRLALAEGRTVDQLGLRAGDRIVVPSEGGGLGALETPLRAFTILISLPATIYGLTRLF